jgi:hypothetical protein
MGGGALALGLALVCRCPANRRSSARRLAMASSADACKSRGGPLLLSVATGGRLLLELLLNAAVRLLLVLLVGVDPPRCFLMGCVRRGDMKLASGLFMVATVMWLVYPKNGNASLSTSNRSIDRSVASVAFPPSLSSDR